MSDSFINFGGDPVNTDEGKRFKDGYNRVMRGDAGWKDALWDPVDGRWENYSTVTYTKVAIARVITSYTTVDAILREVISIGHVTRNINPQIVWWPKYGYWYQWRLNQQQGPPAPPRPPTWLQQMNAELDAIASDPSMSPLEKEQARLARIQHYFGVARHE